MLPYCHYRTNNSGCCYRKMHKMFLHPEVQRKMHLASDQKESFVPYCDIRGITVLFLHRTDILHYTKSLCNITYIDATHTV